jgi:predicted DNA-binding transcriptional regulator AlpA
MSKTVNLYEVGGTAEVAKWLECPKQQIHSLRKNSKFPEPVHTISASPLWLMSDVMAFKDSWKRRAKKV